MVHQMYAKCVALVCSVNVEMDGILFQRDVVCANIFGTVFLYRYIILDA